MEKRGQQHGGSVGHQRLGEEKGGGWNEWLRRAKRWKRALEWGVARWKGRKKQRPEVGKCKKSLLATQEAAD